MMVAASPASPNLRISSESENCSAMNEMPAVPWVSTQAGPTTSTAFLNAVYLVLARDQPVARGECQLHRVGEADDHDERRHHVEEHVETETGPAEPAERQQDRDQRRERRDDHERDLAEEHDRDDAAGEDAERCCRSGRRARPRCGFRAA